MGLNPIPQSDLMQADSFMYVVVSASSLCPDQLSSHRVQAASQQSHIETLVNRFAMYYTPLVVLACLVLILVPAAMRKPDLEVSHPACGAAQQQHSGCACLLLNCKTKVAPLSCSSCSRVSAFSVQRLFRAALIGSLVNCSTYLSPAYSVC